MVAITNFNNIGKGMSNGHKYDESEHKQPQNTWREIEIVGNSRNLSPVLWTFTHLTGLYLRDNGISRIPAEISKLRNLTKLDLSKNKIRSLPNEIGDMIELNDLDLSYNSLRVLPNELGRLFRLKNLGLQGNPLPSEIMSLQLDKLLTLMLDNLTGKNILWVITFKTCFRNYLNVTSTLMLSHIGKILPQINKFHSHCREPLNSLSMMQDPYLIKNIV